MKSYTYGEADKPTLLLIPGLGVSHEIFLPLIELLKGQFSITTVDNDGFIIGHTSQFTSVDDQAIQIISASLQASLAPRHHYALRSRRGRWNKYVSEQIRFLWNLEP